MMCDSHSPTGTGDTPNFPATDSKTADGHTRWRHAERNMATAVQTATPAVKQGLAQVRARL
jgi:hypothetical protein